MCDLFSCQNSSGLSPSTLPVLLFYLPFTKQEEQGSHWEVLDLGKPSGGGGAREGSKTKL